MDEKEIEFYKKVIKVQSALKAPKNQINKFGGYKYRSCEDILEAVKPLCVKEGLVLTLSDEIVEVGSRIYVKAEATLSDGAVLLATSAYARESEEKKGMDCAQITGASSSYARKYALNGLFCIDDVKDADSEEVKAGAIPQVTALVTKEQIKELQDLNVDIQRLCIYYKVKDLESLPKKAADEAIARKKSQTAKEGK